MYSYDPTWEVDYRDASETAYQDTLPVALLPQRVARFKLNDTVTTRYSATGQLRKVTAMYFEKGHPVGWWYQLEGSEHWYKEERLWSVKDWHEYQIQQSINQLGLQEWLNTVDERSEKHQAWLQEQYRLAAFWYGNAN